MKVPGHAWLEMAVAPAAGGCRLDLTALFEPTPGSRAARTGTRSCRCTGSIFAGLLRAVAAAASPA